MKVTKYSLKLLKSDKTAKKMSVNKKILLKTKEERKDYEFQQIQRTIKFNNRLPNNLAQQTTEKKFQDNDGSLEQKQIHIKIEE